MATEQNTSRNKIGTRLFMACLYLLLHPIMALREVFFSNHHQEKSEKLYKNTSKVSIFTGLSIITTYLLIAVFAGNPIAWLTIMPTLGAVGLRFLNIGPKTNLFSAFVFAAGLITFSQFIFFPLVATEGLAALSWLIMSLAPLTIGAGMTKLGFGIKTTAAISMVSASILFLIYGLSTSFTTIVIGIGLLNFASFAGALLYYSVKHAEINGNNPIPTTLMTILPAAFFIAAYSLGFLQTNISFMVFTAPVFLAVTIAIIVLSSLMSLSINAYQTKEIQKFQNPEKPISAFSLVWKSILTALFGETFSDTQEKQAPVKTLLPPHEPAERKGEQQTKDTRQMLEAMGLTGVDPEESTSSDAIASYSAIHEDIVQTSQSNIEPPSDAKLRTDSLTLVDKICSSATKWRPGLHGGHTHAGSSEEQNKSAENRSITSLSHD